MLRDSQIRFQGTRPIDPALQVDAQRVISGVTAIVNIRGTARQPQVRLSSTPPLDEADVLSLIVFNQPINQLGEGERLNLAERAGGLAAGYLASPLANSIADALDLDIFEIRATGGINGQPSVALGQQIRVASVRLIPSGIRIGRAAASSRWNTGSTSSCGSSARSLRAPSSPTAPSGSTRPASI